MRGFRTHSPSIAVEIAAQIVGIVGLVAAESTRACRIVDVVVVDLHEQDEDHELFEGPYSNSSDQERSVNK